MIFSPKETCPDQASDKDWEDTAGLCNKTRNQRARKLARARARPTEREREIFRHSRERETDRSPQREQERPNHKVEVSIALTFLPIVNLLWALLFHFNCVKIPLSDNIGFLVTKSALP